MPRSRRRSIPFAMLFTVLPAVLLAMSGMCIATPSRAQGPPNAAALLRLGAGVAVPGRSDDDSLHRHHRPRKVARDRRTPGAGTAAGAVLRDEPGAPA